MNVRVASVLFEYTNNRAMVEAEGATLAALLEDLDLRHPGLRFRIVDEQDRVRAHMNVFVGGRSVRNLATKLKAGDEVSILQALSGG